MIIEIYSNFIIFCKYFGLFTIFENVSAIAQMGVHWNRNIKRRELNKRRGKRIDILP